ncbi:hypothetical protein E2C01_019707 [Portunus trituberculatus]|uniref:Uncharacterized protein n=1 Tax=Portunus trituberculatus TaxID=210409 RepID=A0A5B7E170_PORTR|nr:hypothetical protein [Portunus trituberculatus]
MLEFGLTSGVSSWMLASNLWRDRRVGRCARPLVVSLARSQSAVSCPSPLSATHLSLPGASRWIKVVWCLSRSWAVCSQPNSGQPVPPHFPLRILRSMSTARRGKVSKLHLLAKSLALGLLVANRLTHSPVFAAVVSLQVEDDFLSETLAIAITTPDGSFLIATSYFPPRLTYRIQICFIYYEDRRLFSLTTPEAMEHFLRQCPGLLSQHTALRSRLSALAITALNLPSLLTASGLPQDYSRAHKDP